MNKREALLSLAAGQGGPGWTPAAFFLHFDSAYHQGQAAIDRHLAFYRHTGMDFVKIQYEQPLPPGPVSRPEDWSHAPLFAPEHFDAPVAVVRGLVEAAGSEALVVMTLYSPFMWARRYGGAELVAEHMAQDPQAVAKGLEIMTENVLTLARACKQAGVDGFYASTQGGEAGRLGSVGLFEKYVKPSDLAVWDEIKSCEFNILHVCDYQAGYDDLTPFLDYPGQIVNCSLTVGERSLTPAEAAAMFGRPFMGGMERTGTIASGSPQAIRDEVNAVLAHAPAGFILAADCTVPGDTPWDNLKTAIEAAHQRPMN